jgi:hypothetical protein
MKTIVGSLAEVHYYLTKVKIEKLKGIISDVISLTETDNYLIITTKDDIDFLINSGAVIKIKILKSAKAKKKEYAGVEIG